MAVLQFSGPDPNTCAVRAIESGPAAGYNGACFRIDLHDHPVLFLYPAVYFLPDPKDRVVILLCHYLITGGQGDQERAVNILSAGDIIADPDKGTLFPCDRIFSRFMDNDRNSFQQSPEIVKGILRVLRQCKAGIFSAAGCFRPLLIIDNQVFR